MSTPTTEHAAAGFSALGADHQPATPGPWTYDSNDGRILSDAGTLLALMQPGGDGGPILTPDEMHANGRLMAAAPTMLVLVRNAFRALSTANDALRDFSADVPGNEFAVLLQHVDADIAMARAALAAATGQPEDE